MHGILFLRRISLIWPNTLNTNLINLWSPLVKLDQSVVASRQTNRTLTKNYFPSAKL